MSLLGSEEQFKEVVEGGTNKLHSSIDNKKFIDTFIDALKDVEMEGSLQEINHSLLEALNAGGVTKKQQQFISASGGAYGMVKNLQKTGRARRLDAGQRKLVNDASAGMERQFDIVTSAGDKEADVDQIRDANTALNSFIANPDNAGESEMEYWSGTNWFGHNSAVTQIEDAWLSELAGQGKTNKLTAVLSGLEDPTILKKLQKGYTPSMGKRELKKLLNDVFPGQKFDEGDAELAGPLLKNIRKGIRDAGGVEAYAKDYMGRGQADEGVSVVLGILKTRKNAEKRQRMTKLYEESTEALVGDQGDRVKDALDTYSRGGRGAAAGMVGILSDEDIKFEEGSSWEDIQGRYEGLVGDGDAAGIKKRLTAEGVTDLAGVTDLQQLQERAAHLAVEQDSFTGANSDAKNTLRTAAGSPEEAANLIREASHAMRVNIAKTQRGTGEFMKTTADSITKINKQVGITHQ